MHGALNYQGGHVCLVSQMVCAEVAGLSRA
jgi:hypothetical protein